MLHTFPRYVRAGRRALKVMSVAAVLATTAMLCPAFTEDSRSRPIAQAILHRDVSVVRSLVAGGEDVDQRLFNRDTPAIMAASSESWDIVLYLLQAGADPTLENRKGLTVATLAKTSRVASHTKAFRDLAEVKKILASKGLL
jgi:ankyrin repeat protein